MIASVLPRAMDSSILSSITHTTLMPVQVAENAQPLSNAAAMLGTLCASGHARLAAQQLMSLLKEALHSVHMPRFWSRLAPFAATDPEADLLEALPAAVQVSFVGPCSHGSNQNQHVASHCWLLASCSLCVHFRGTDAGRTPAPHMRAAKPGNHALLQRLMANIVAWVSAAVVFARRS